MSAEQIARALGGGKERKNGAGWTSLCLLHDDSNPSLSLKDGADGDVIVHCFSGCDPLAIKDELRSRSLLPEWKPTCQPRQSSPRQDFGGRGEGNKPATHEEEKPSYPWKMASRDEQGLTHIKKYFSSRAINLDEIPVCFKWGSYVSKTGERIDQIVAAVSKPGDESVFACHRTIIDPTTGERTDKLMLGKCLGRGVWLDRKGPMFILVVGEGIETVLSAVQATKYNGVAGLSASGLEALEFPSEANHLIVLVDSDTNQTGQRAAVNLARRFEASATERSAELVTPDDTCFSGSPKKLDFNDLLKADPTGESIRARFEVAILVQDLVWDEPAKDEPEQPKTPMDIFMKYELSDEYVNGIGKEEFLYPDLIIKNHILVLIAESGGGKTTFVFFTVAPYIAKQGYQVLYFDADSPPSDHPRMKRFADENGFKHLNPDVNLGTSVSSLISDLEGLAAKQMSLDRYVIFFDTMKKFIDLMGKREAKSFFILMRKLTKLGATISLLGHANKHRDAEGRLVFEGVGDVKNDCDDMLFFERDRMPDGSLNVTMICDTDKGAKVRGVFKPFSFSISPEREVAFYEKALEAVDLSGTGTPKATDSEILDCAEQYLRDLGEPVVQSDLVEYTADRVEGQAGVERVRKLIVKRSVLKSNFTTKKEMPFGARFLFEGGNRNKRLYQLPAEPPMQRPVFGEGP